MDLSPTALTIIDELIKMEAQKKISLGSLDWDVVPAIFSTLEAEGDWLANHPNTVPCGAELQRLVKNIVLTM